MSKILITGFSGFLGSHLTDRLLNEGNEVIGIDRSIKYQNITQHPNLTLVPSVISENIGELFKGVDIVVHMAALTRPQWSILYPLETNEVNVSGTLKMLIHARDNKVKRFVFISTSNLYGDTVYPTPEEAKPSPMNAYALSKLIGEQYCELFYRLYGLEYNVIRPFNAYGTRMPITGIYTSAVATFINAMKKDISFKMFGDGTQRRDFVYIDDIVDQIMLMATSKVNGEVFNCGFGKNYSINEMLNLVRKLMKKEVKPEERLEKQYEPSQTLADISKAERLLGWKPKIDLEEGLRRIIND